MWHKNVTMKIWVEFKYKQIRSQIKKNHANKIQKKKRKQRTNRHKNNAYYSINVQI